MKPHRTDGVSLTFGLIFLAVAAWWLVAQLVDLALPVVGWFLAVALILLGVLGLVAALRSGRTVAPPAGGSTASDTTAPDTAAPDTALPDTALPDDGQGRRQEPLR